MLLDSVSFPEIRPTYKKMELEGIGEFAVDDRSPDLELYSIIWILSSWALTNILKGAEVACGTLLIMEPCSPLRRVGKPDDLDAGLQTDKSNSNLSKSNQIKSG
jgi:hypothetical protein